MYIQQCHGLLVLSLSIHSHRVDECNFFFGPLLFLIPSNAIVDFLKPDPPFLQTIHPY